MANGMTPEELLEYRKKWIKQHPSRRKEHLQNYYKKHKEEQIQRVKDYYEEHIDERKEYAKKYYQEHKEEIARKRKEPKPFIPLSPEEKARKIEEIRKTLKKRDNKPPF